MLKKLRLQFITVLMIFVTAMLALVFGLICFFTAQKLEQSSIGMMQAIAAGPDRPGRPDDQSQDLRLPYFTIRIGTDGQATGHGGYYDLSDQDFLAELVAAAAGAGRSVGLVEQYNLRFLRLETPKGQILVFSDISSERTTMNNLIRTCAGIGALCFIGFLGIAVLLAHWMVRPVDKAWKQQRQFVSDASHELKTPLTVITTNAELLQGPCSPEQEARYAANILTVSGQMRALVERLLELARTEDPRDRPLFRQLDLSALTERALLPFEPIFFEKDMVLESAIQPGVTVLGSAQHLSQLTGILLDNARKHAAPGGPTVLKLRRTGPRHCSLTVSNPAEPLSPEELKAIFTRFYRRDPARSRDGSFGLGLSIAENIVRQHRGRIWAESRDGTLCVTVELPVK